MSKSKCINHEKLQLKIAKAPANIIIVRLFSNYDKLQMLNGLIEPNYSRHRSQTSYSDSTVGQTAFGL